MVKAARDSNKFTGVVQNSTAKMVKFDPPITFQLPDSEKTLKICQVKMGDTLIDAQFGNCYSGSTEEGLDLLMTQVRFEGAFYHTIHGRKKLALVSKKIQELEKVRYSSLYCRLLGVTFVDVGEQAIDLWIASENHDGTLLEKLLKCSGCFSLNNSMIYIESILDALCHLHACNVAHQGTALGSVYAKLIRPHHIKHFHLYQHIQGQADKPSLVALTARLAPNTPGIKDVLSSRGDFVEAT